MLRPPLRTKKTLGDPPNQLISPVRSLRTPPLLPSLSRTAASSSTPHAAAFSPHSPAPPADRLLTARLLLRLHGSSSTVICRRPLAPPARLLLHPSHSSSANAIGHRRAHTHPRISRHIGTDQPASSLASSLSVPPTSLPPSLLLSPCLLPISSHPTPSLASSPNVPTSAAPSLVSFPSHLLPPHASTLTKTPRTAASSSCSPAPSW